MKNNDSENFKKRGQAIPKRAKIILNDHDAWRLSNRLVASHFISMHPIGIHYGNIRDAILAHNEDIEERIDPKDWQSYKISLICDGTCRRFVRFLSDVIHQCPKIRYSELGTFEVFATIANYTYKIEESIKKCFPFDVTIIGRNTPIVQTTTKARGEEILKAARYVNPKATSFLVTNPVVFPELKDFLYSTPSVQDLFILCPPIETYADDLSKLAQNQGITEDKLLVRLKDYHECLYKLRDLFQSSHNIQVKVTSTLLETMHVAVMPNFNGKKASSGMSIVSSSLEALFSKRCSFSYANNADTTFQSELEAITKLWESGDNLKWNEEK